MSVGVGRSNGQALIEVRDDGVGGAAAEAAPGCAGSPTGSRRWAGASMLESPAGAGTTLRAEIPCVH